MHAKHTQLHIQNTPTCAMWVCAFSRKHTHPFRVFFVISLWDWWGQMGEQWESGLPSLEMQRHACTNTFHTHTCTHTGSQTWSKSGKHTNGQEKMLLEKCHGQSHAHLCTCKHVLRLKNGSTFIQDSRKIARSSHTVLPRAGAI